MRDDAFLRDCLVDGEAGTRRRTSKMRRRALAAALVLEGIVISGLMLWPLFTRATPPPQFVALTPLPYLRGVRLTRPVRAATQTPGGGRNFAAPNFPHLQVIPLLRTPGHALQTVVPPPIGEMNPQGLNALPQAANGFNSSPAILPAPARVRIVRRTEQIQESQLVSRVMPTYPQVARIAHITGTVELLTLVGGDGRVLSVQVLSGSPLLAAAAKEAVEQWRYRPAMVDGQAVEVEARVTVKFVMDE